MKIYTCNEIANKMTDVMKKLAHEIGGYDENDLYLYEDVTHEAVQEVIDNNLTLNESDYIDFINSFACGLFEMYFHDWNDESYDKNFEKFDSIELF